MRRRQVLISLAASGLLARVGAARERAPIAATTAGRVRGRSVGAACAFRGIPYGASTAGAQRFLPPARVEPWSGVRDALAYGPACPQGGRARPGESRSEDCLTLNVYTPSADGTRRAVIVWLHGGGYASGSGNAPYDGSRLCADHDVVFVAVNHRLSVLGFLDLSGLDERYADSGNVGMLDIVAALRWVRDNIGSFGGDPGNVTVVGQSGGGAKVSTCLAMPTAHGLFHRAIPMSGAVLTALTREQARTLTQALLHQLGVLRDPLGALQALPAERLIQAMFAIGSTGTPDSTRLNFGPVVDGRALPRQTFEPDAPVVSAAVPILVGSTHDETRLFYVSEPGFATLSEAAMRARLASTMKTDVPTVTRVVDAFRSRLPHASPAQLFLTITTQYMFTRNSALMAERKARQARAHAFRYRFDWASPGPIGARIGAAHAVDVPLTLDLPGPSPLLDSGPARDAMTAHLSRVWAQFARSGDPNRAGLPPWPAYGVTQHPTMLLDTQCRVVAAPDGALRETWGVLPPFHP